MLVLVPPVPGPIIRPFAYAGSPFAAGLHRGADLAASPGAAVSAPCGGVVAWAGPEGVTLVCRRRRVTLLPMRPTVRVGDAVAPGAPVGAVAGREGLHLGVRAIGDPFGYVDPAPLMRRPRPSPPPGVPRGPRARARPALPLHPVAAPAVRGAPALAAPLAPWTAWLGAGVLLTGAAGGARLRVARTRRRRAVAAAGTAEGVP